MPLRAMDGMSNDERLSVLEVKIEALDRRVAAVEQGLHILGAKIDALRTEMMTQFRWTLGVMCSLSAGIITAILTH